MRDVVKLGRCRWRALAVCRVSLLRRLTTAAFEGELSGRQSGEHRDALEKAASARGSVTLVR